MCKITDENDNLLYFDEECKDPAIFSRLDNGTETTADMDGAFSYLKNKKENIKLYWKDGEQVKRYEGGTFYVKMLVDEYMLTKYIASNKDNQSWQTIVLTTETDRTGRYPFRGLGDKTTIYRTTSVGSSNPMVFVRSNIKLENIILDGSEITTTKNKVGSILHILDKGKLTVGSGTIIQNAVTNQQEGAAISITVMTDP